MFTRTLFSLIYSEPKTVSLGLKPNVSQADDVGGKAPTD
jgi:hypothetical protein